MLEMVENRARIGRALLHASQINLRCNTQLHHKIHTKRKQHIAYTLSSNTEQKATIPALVGKKKGQFHIFNPSGNYKDSLVYTRLNSKGYVKIKHRIYNLYYIYTI